ncbi:hypothetical protein CC1G_07775 [Coprinopsis cinerea okayama7|uniref:Uncharacterized protein n=1 Tax=Coprinopsis cinerea (strain Okayama-7 / 130 / ATCC MYA-4618 / FGSC 9003) TaxID=240176 RepID=A8NNZ8_COPC7|nr:hypothetical protein CC1G_07775 [Coprinopsis cinerea okayama7\|eukprot:XP_001835232.1 hypothetical protein CC1G_07775 [Coprinopsis cinerea okayama7\
MARKTGKSHPVYTPGEQNALDMYMDGLSLNSDESDTGTYDDDDASSILSSQTAQHRATSSTIPGSSAEIYQQFRDKKLQEVQLLNQQLIAERDEMKLQLRQLQAGLKSMKEQQKQRPNTNNSNSNDDGSDNDGNSKKSHPKRPSPTTGNAAHDKKIGEMGRRFWLLNEMFIDKNWFMKEKPANNSMEGRYPPEKDKQEEAPV